MAQRIITLTTDFGWDEPYAGAMKGAILAVNPDVNVVDITHGVPPHDIRGGAMILASSYRFFPAGTIHTAVVDPGVGGGRRGLLVISEAHSFVGPDNGILSLVLDELETFTCIELTSTHYFRKEVSSTFHGRDIFGPVAAWLAKGINPRHFGAAVTDPVRLPPVKANVSPGKIEGEVTRADRFGNLITNVTVADLAQAFDGGPAVCLIGDEAAISVRGHYGEVGKGEALALVGSGGFLEVAVNQGRAADRFKARAGQRVTVTAI